MLMMIILMELQFNVLVFPTTRINYCMLFCSSHKMKRDKQVTLLGAYNSFDLSREKNPLNRKQWRNWHHECRIAFSVKSNPIVLFYWSHPRASLLREFPWIQSMQSIYERQEFIWRTNFSPQYSRQQAVKF